MITPLLRRWTTRTLAAVLATMIAGIVGVVLLMPDGPWSPADIAWLVGTAAVLSTLAAVLLFVPFTLIGSRVPRPFAVGVPPLLLVAAGCASYLSKFGLESPVAGDRQLVVTLIWCSSLAGQSIHALLILGRSDRPVV